MFCTYRLRWQIAQPCLHWAVSSLLSNLSLEDLGEPRIELNRNCISRQPCFIASPRTDCWIMLVAPGHSWISLCNKVPFFLVLQLFSLWVRNTDIVFTVTRVPFSLSLSLGTWLDFSWPWICDCALASWEAGITSLCHQAFDLFMLGESYFLE